MRSLSILLLGSTMALAEPAPKQSGGAPDCFCTDKTGARVDLGQEICLLVDDRAFMARCEMSLNNPMWRPTGQDCLSSRVRQSLRPTG